MKQQAQNTPTRRWPFLTGWAIFFLCFYVYTWKAVQPYLIYHSLGIVIKASFFSKGWLYFTEQWSQLGGPVEYFAAFLSQWYYYNWLGALIITLVTALLCISTTIFIRSTTKKSGSILGLVPAFCILTIYCSYDNPLLIILGLLFAIISSVIHISSDSGSTWYRLGRFVIMFVLLYYLAAGISLLFAVIAGIYEVFCRKTPAQGILYILSAVIIVFIIGVFALGQEAIDAFLWQTTFHWRLRTDFTHGFELFMTFLYCFYILLIPLGLLWHKLTARFKRRTLLIAALQATLLLFFGSAVVHLSTDVSRKTACIIVYMNHHEMWEELLSYIAQMPRKYYSMYHNFCVNRALYKIGRMGDNLFFYPQKPDSLLLTIAKKRSDLAEIEACRLFMELGLINLVKGRTKNARMYFEQMSRDLIYGKRGKEFLRGINEGIEPDNVKHMRSVMMQSDCFFADTHVESLLLKLLDDNPHNRMAFEYLMAHYMLRGKLEKFVKNLARLNDFGFRRMPRHYEEALLTHNKIYNKNFTIPGMQINPQTLARFDHFKEVLDKFKSKTEASNAMFEEFGHTYFYYYVFYGTVE
jgi:hypothetical protein